MRDTLSAYQRLQAAPDSFDFFAALRRLECAYPDKPRIGTSHRAQDDAVRFGQQPSLAFEGAALHSFTPGADGAPDKLQVNFFGLMGANGPLPVHLTDYVRDRLRNANDPTLASFLDLFHHRLIALFYRAWASAQPAVSLDRPDTDRFADYIASLIGTGVASLQQRDAAPDYAKLHYAGRLSAQSRNAEGLAAILNGFFKLPVQVEQFVGHWMTLPADGLCRLRSGPDAERLGVSTVLGTRVWNRQHKFRLVIGPVDAGQLTQMLPGGVSVERLVAWVRNYAGLEYDWDVRLIVKKQALPPLRLGRGARLGWTTWLSGRPPPQDDSQLRFSPLQHAA